MTAQGKLIVRSFSISLDGYGAGPDQSLENPMGVGVAGLHQWAIVTRTFQTKVFGKDGGTAGPDDDWAAMGFENLGAWIMGRNMFGPIRDAWPDDTWKGWWGDNPPYHCPVFVLTHYARPSITMEGGTVFHFVTDGIEAALKRARHAAGTKDIRVGGGVATIREYLRARLIDDLHIAVSPMLLGSGESLFNGIDLPKLGYECAEHVTSPNATHFMLRKA